MNLLKLLQYTSQEFTIIFQFHQRSRIQIQALFNLEKPKKLLKEVVKDHKKYKYHENTH